MIMNSNFLPNHQQLSVISNLKKSEELPFSEVLSKEEIEKHVKKIKHRDRIFAPHTTLWAFLSQVMDDDPSQQAAVARVIASAIAQGKEPPSANTSAYSQARTRLPEKILSELTQETAIKIEEETPEEWLWRGRKIKLIDGSTLSMPDTPGNQKDYPQSDQQKSGVGFPIMRIVVIIAYVTGVLLDLAMGPYKGKKTGEHALLRQLISSFKEGEIILGDSYYPSFFLMAQLMKLGVDAVFPMHGARNHDFRRGKRLGKKEHIIAWKKPSKPEWMEREEYESFPSEILVREVSVTNERSGFRSISRVLVTTFLDPKEVSKSDLSELYDCRWFVEITLRSIKETMHMDILRGKTPEMVRKEIWVHILAYNLVRKIMAQSAFLKGKKANTLSFKGALQFIKAFWTRGILDENNLEVYLKLLELISYKSVGNRPGRAEPRRVKRRPKAFPRLQKSREFYKNAA